MTLLGILFLLSKLRSLQARAACLGTIAWGVMAVQSLAQVHFDVNSSAPVRSLHPNGTFSQFPNSRLVAVDFDVSTLFQPGVAQSTREILIQCMSRREGVLIVDYSPKTELQTDVFGPMQVVQEQDASRDMALQGLAGYPGIGSATGSWNQSEFQRQSIQYAQRPSLELTLASGSLQRQRGVYFKIRPNSQSTLEGSKTFSLVLSVPANWRADLLDVTVQAAGIDPRAGRRETVLAKQSFVIGIYQQNDAVAAQAIAEYVKQQSNLSRSVKTYAKKIEQRTYPTPFHKLGAKLDLYEPEIPENWLDAVIYKPAGNSYATTHQLQMRLAALPVDVRVAVMNFQDQKARIESLAGEEWRGSEGRSNDGRPVRRESIDGPQTYTLGYRGAENAFQGHR